MPNQNSPVTALVNATWLSIGVALTLVLLGAFAAIMPLAVGVAVSILIVWIIAFSGLAHLVHAWDARGNALFTWRLGVGLLYLAGGIYLLLNPQVTLATLVLFIGGMFVVEALLLSGASFWLRGLPGSGWIAADAVVTLVLAAIMLGGGSWARPWMLGVLVGLNILSSGFAYLSLLRANGISGWRNAA